MYYLTIDHGSVTITRQSDGKSHFGLFGEMLSPIEQGIIRKGMQLDLDKEDIAVSHRALSMVTKAVTTAVVAWAEFDSVQIDLVKEVEII